ncbi:MAG TPA: hypothetical protein VMB50_09805 [Myxococcales bacterium]|nr:hypothetical protein [Myxococcales bacterium]
MITLPKTRSTHRWHRLVLAAFLTALPALGQEAQPSPPPQEVTPQGTAPTAAPPPPPENPPPPPAAEGQPAPPTTQADGQWIYTGQYGWVWLPYGDEYVYTPEDEVGEPFIFLYEPAYGWRWVAAPWVWGHGPLPYFGKRGPWRFHWYRGPAYRAHVPGRPLFHSGYAPRSGGVHGGRRR